MFRPRRVWALSTTAPIETLISIVIFFTLVDPLDGWISLSSEGYLVQQNLIASAGVTVSGSVTVNGVIISAPVANLECNTSRRGALRWNDRFFEGCDGETDWRPITFCSRSCKINTRSVPCGIPVKNLCGLNCAQSGTGLNMEHCILRVATTPCHQPVKDQCANECGLAGQFACDALTSEYGAVMIKSLPGVEPTSAFQLAVGKMDTSSNGTLDGNSLFLTFKDMDGTSEDLAMFRKNDTHSAGLEIAPSDSEQHTFRISMPTHLNGQIIELGNRASYTHIFLDGIIDKECPFVFNGGDLSGRYTKMCLEMPTSNRTITISDADGRIITSGNREDIENLPGLQGDNVFVFTGTNKMPYTIEKPAQPRLECARFECSGNSTIGFDKQPTVCPIDYKNASFDVFRVYYTIEDWSNANIQGGMNVKAALVNASQRNFSRRDLALLYLELTNSIGLPSQMLFPDFPVTDMERCFVCCCPIVPSVPPIVVPKDPVQCARRMKPGFCVGGGSHDGETCYVDSNCGPLNRCVENPDLICSEIDSGYDCSDISHVPNFTTAVNFTTPTKNRRILFPDASGMIVSTGNLQDITTLGVQEAPISGRSSNTTVTTLLFERTFDPSSRLRQVSSNIMNNTLYFPSAADGILLTTGNLEDITLDSGRMSGLTVSTDVHVNGWLAFGNDTLSTGIRLPPGNASAVFTSPEGGQPRGNRRPGQLTFDVNSSSVVLEFEPSASPGQSKVAYLTVPGTNGTILTTGNLEDITAESSNVSSLSVAGLSYLQGGITIQSSEGKQLKLLGESVGTIQFSDIRSSTILNFQTQVNSNASILFPAVSGTVITTGNLQDIVEYNGKHLNVSGTSKLSGSVTIGTNGSTPIRFSGYISEDLVHRTAPNPNSNGEFSVPAPFSWATRSGMICSNVDSPVLRKVNKQSDESQCKALCETLPGCGIVITKVATDLSTSCTLYGISANVCQLAVDKSSNTFLYMRDESTTLTFESPTGTRNMWFPDASGIIISTGNLQDITNLQGLTGSNPILYSTERTKSKTIIDFAAIGTSPETRRPGVLPDYYLPNGQPAHPLPTGKNRRITFPDATGTVITTGNTDDLVFKKIQLSQLKVQSAAHFGNDNGAPSFVNFGVSSRITGCLNFITSVDTPNQYAQVCMMPPTKDNTIMLPDATGTILTTGNLLNLPVLNISQGHLFVGGDTAFEGNITLGRQGGESTVEFYTWIDGDVGLNFGGAGNTTGSVYINAPVMNGMDRALRKYLNEKVLELPVNVQDHEQFMIPVNGTTQVNQSTCQALLTGAGVLDFNGVAPLLLKHSVMQATRVSVIPYCATLMMGNRTIPQCVDRATSTVICEGPRPLVCPCQDTSNSEMRVGWQSIGPEQQMYCPLAGNKFYRVQGQASNFQGCGTVCQSPQDPYCTVDFNSSTTFTSMIRSTDARVSPVSVEGNVSRFIAYGSNAYSTYLIGPCILGVKFVSPTTVTLVRIFLRDGQAVSMIGARLEASQDTEGKGVWTTLSVLNTMMLENAWNDFMVPSEYQALKFRWGRLVGMPCSTKLQNGSNSSSCGCAIAEWEWHTGEISQHLTSVKDGSRSYFVNEAKLTTDPLVASVLKCVSYRWIPSYLTSRDQQLNLPEATGVLLTTGNLHQITKDAGSITNLGIIKDLWVGRSSSFGTPDAGDTLEINSKITGRFPLSFGDDGAAGQLTLHLSDGALDNVLSFPDRSGSILTTGSLPAAMDQLKAVGNSSLRGSVVMTADVTIGDPTSPSSLVLNSVISGAFPLHFAGASLESPQLALGLMEPSEDRILMLPDASGTLLTTGNLPHVLDSTTFLGDTVFLGGVNFDDNYIRFGTRDQPINVSVNAVLKGAVPLTFEGKSADGRTISLAVEEPSGGNLLMLPDVSGTIITTGNFPEVLETLHVVGESIFNGNVHLKGPFITFGSPDQASRIKFNAPIVGRFPLVFANAYGSDGNSIGRTTFEVTPSASPNLITIPDISGTVITTGNIPTTIVVEDTYTIQARSFVASADSVAIGYRAKEPTHIGSFVFTDMSDIATNSESTFTSMRSNSFNVRATGGVKFITGYTKGGRELGVVLEPKSSSWSVLSDRDSKTDIERVDCVKTLRKLVSQVPISTWEYEDSNVRHMGPMAQDFYDAFELGDSRTEISTIDADGVAFAAIHGLQELQSEEKRILKELEHQVHLNNVEIEKNEEVLLQSLQDLEHRERLLKLLYDEFKFLTDG